MEELNDILPAPWSHGNPIDVLGDADPERYAKALETAARDPESDGLLVVLTPQDMTEPTETAQGLVPYAQSTRKPVLASWMGGPEVAAGNSVLNGAGIPTFEYPDAAARSFTNMWRYTYNLRGIYETPELADDADVDRERAEEILAGVREAGRTILTEFESKDLLAAYGIPTVETRVANSADEAVELADAIGYPVVLKLNSQTITHKTDVGGVRLNLEGPREVRRGLRGDGALRLRELLARGLRRGHGAADGRPGWIRAHPGQQHRPPVRPRAALRLGRAARRGLQGPRAGPPAADHRRSPAAPWSEPASSRPWAACAAGPLSTRRRSRSSSCVSPSSSSSSRLSRRWTSTRCSPHPSASSPSTPASFCTRPIRGICPAPPSGPTRPSTCGPRRPATAEPITIRPIRPEDEPLMVRFHETLSEQSVYMRYFHMLGLTQRIAHERLTRICFIDYDREMALVAERQDPESGEREIMGVARLSRARQRRRRVRVLGPDQRPLPAQGPRHAPREQAPGGGPRRGDQAHHRRHPLRELPHATYREEAGLPPPPRYRGDGRQGRPRPLPASIK